MLARSSQKFACLAISVSAVARSSALVRLPTVIASNLLSSKSRSSSSRLYSTSVEDYDELPLDFPRREDVLVALEAVRKASAVTNALQPESAEGGIATVSKVDTSPVTVGDFSAQAVVLRHLKESFKSDSFIAEESSQALNEDSVLAELVLDATSMEDVEIVKRSIDLGKEYESWDKLGGRPPRVWCLDPIDGTKGFLRGRRDGGQYCVALALIEDGEPTIGILGCPNLPAGASDFNYAWGEDETFANNQDTRGCIFVASQGGGCYQLPVIPGAPSKRLRCTPNDGSTMSPSQARFCVGVEKFSDALGQCAGMAKILHGDGALSEDGDIVLARRIDSQAKYGVLARGGAEYYARLPRPGYVEWIWDHAAGKVVIEEAGGVMTDTLGDAIDFSLGPKLSKDVKGVLGSPGGQFHDALIDAFREQEVIRLKGLEESPAT